MAWTLLKTKAKFNPCYKEKRYTSRVLNLHDLPGLHTFHRFYQEFEKVSSQPPAIIFESTGHYHKPVLQFLEDQDIAYYLVNQSFLLRLERLVYVK